MNPSIVDYLNSTGKASDYNSRATLAKSQGISNYTGTAEQNTTLLNQLRGGGTSTTPTVVTSANINEKVIPGITDKVNNLTKNAGATTTTDTKDKNIDLTGNDALLKQYGLEGTSEADVENSIKNSPQYKELEQMKSMAMSQNDTTYQSTLDTIKNQFANKYRDLYSAQNSQNAQLGNLLQLTGAVKTSGENAIMTAKTNYDIQSLNEMQALENSAVAQAKAAHDAKSFEIAQTALANVDKIREQKNKIAQTISENLAKEAKESKLKMIQASRDNAVAGLVLQGITDPKKLMDMLNYDEAGSQIGDFTAEELQKSLKNLSPEGNYDKLSGDVRDYMILKEQGLLPEGITTIKQWIDYSQPTKTPGLGSVNKITLTEAKNQGLPLSVVGMSEDQIAQSFQSQTPPQWFVEKTQKERNQSIPASGLQSEWDTYRNSYTSKYEGGPVSSVEKTQDANIEKATDYFKSAYGDALDDGTIQQLADRVNLYVLGGTPYNDAIQKVTAEAQ